MIALPNPFDSVAAVSSAPDAAAAAVLPAPQAAAVPNSVSPGDCLNSLPSGESEPSVMLAFAPGESLSSGGPEEIPAVTAHHLTAAGDSDAFDPDAITADDEALYQHLKRSVDWNARHLPAMPNEQAFMAELDEPPLFLRRYRALR